MDEALSQLLTLGRGCFLQKQYADAEKYLAQFVEKNQGFAEVYNMLGLIFHEQGQFARAQAAHLEDPSEVGRSARNRFVGLVTEVVTDKVMAPWAPTDSV